MISSVATTPLNYNSAKYNTLEEKAAAIRFKNLASRRDSEGARELVWYPDNGPVLCWVNEETESYASHWHPAVEIIMPFSNIYTARLDNQTFTLEEGQILVIPPGILHELNAPKTGSRLVLLVNYSSIGSLPGFSTICSLLINPLLIFPGTPAYEKIRDILLSIMNLYADDELYWSLSISALFIQFLIELSQLQTYSNTLLPQLGSGKQKEYIQKFNSVFNYIDQNYMEDLDLETVAKAVGFSKFHFSRLFKQFTNTSFNDYLNNRRIQAAIALLSSSELSITEIALMSGFPSISTFNRVFRNIKKCTPTEFKKYQK